MKYTCIKPVCSNEYESDEQEAYYCPSCVEANKAIAQQVDAKIAARPKRKRASLVQEYEASRNMTVNGMRGMHVKI